MGQFLKNLELERERAPKQFPKFHLLIKTRKKCPLTRLLLLKIIIINENVVNTLFHNGSLCVFAIS